MPYNQIDHLSIKIDKGDIGSKSWEFQSNDLVKEIREFQSSNLLHPLLSVLGILLTIQTDQY